MSKDLSLAEKLIEMDSDIEQLKLEVKKMLELITLIKEWKEQFSSEVVDNIIERLGEYRPSTKNEKVGLV